MPTPDRRRARTRLALRDALLSLLPTHSWDELSIAQLCERANLGRSTFYLHFSGKDELLDATLNDLRTALRAQALGEIRQGSARLPLAGLPGLVAHLAGNRVALHAVAGRRSSQGVERRFRALVQRLLGEDLQAQGLSGGALALAAAALGGACVDLMVQWSESGEPSALPALEALLQRLASACLGSALSDVPGALQAKAPQG